MMVSVLKCNFLFLSDAYQKAQSYVEAGSSHYHPYIGLRRLIRLRLRMSSWDMHYLRLPPSDGFRRYVVMHNLDAGNNWNLVNNRGIRKILHRNMLR